MQWWWWVVCATLAAKATCPPAPCAALCHCRRDHLACSSVPFHRFPYIEESVRHVSVSQARLGTLGEAALDARALRTLVLVASRIHHIEHDALASMVLTLASLDLGYNEFTEAPLDALRGLKVLNWLNLQNNYISDIKPDMDWGFLAESLSSLSLSNNHLVSLEAGAFSSLVQLVQLDLDGNRLHVVEGSAFPESLALVRLSDNLLEQLPCSTLARLPRLRRLHLRANMLRPALNASCRLDRLKIDSLDLSQNELDDRFIFALQHRVSLKQLILDLNEFTSIPSFVADCGRLEKLSISYNKVKHVSEALLHALKRDLERLDLEHNDVKEIPPGVRDLLRLRHLSLAYNNLEQLLHLPPHLHSLSLAGNYFDTFPVGLVGLAPATLAYLDLGYNQISEMTWELFGAWSEALVTLNLKGNRISQMSSDAFPATLPLRELVLSFNDLYYVESIVFQNLTHLQMLELSSTLFSGEFPFATPLDKISWLSLDNNNIHRIHVDDFYNFPSLEYLNLDFNKLIEFPIETDRENDTYRLKELRLSYNYISKLNGKFMSRLADLQSVDLSYNRLNIINDYTFVDLHNLIYLSVVGNILDTIATGAFRRLPRLEMLELQDNRLTIFSTRYFEEVSSEDIILTVNASHNHISTLLGGDTTSYIKVLDLSHNNIQIIHRNFFEPSGRHLRQLILSHNKISTLDYNSLGSVPSLQVLHLSNNDIRIVKRRAFVEMPSLEILDLSHNYIHQLAVEQFHSLRELRHLLLNGNELRSLPRDCFKNTVVEHLDLSDNQLGLFPSSALAQVGFTLRRLEAARNHLEYLDAAMFYSIAFLHELALGSNALTVLSDNTFAGLTRLRSLDLSGNAIKTNFKELFHNIPRLKHLSLANAGLRAVPHLPLVNLTLLNISGNHIASYREMDVRRLGELRVLDLSKNKFTSLQPAMWAAMPYLTSVDVSGNPVVRMARGSLEGLGRLLHLRMERLRHLEAVEPRAFRPLRALRSLVVDSPVTGAARADCTAGDVGAAPPALEQLTVVMWESALDSQLHALRGARLRTLEVRGAALRRVAAHAFRALGGQRALELRLRGTGVAALPAGLVRPLASVPHLGLDFSNNQLVTFAPATLYPNLTGWNRLATKLIPGGLVLSGNPLRCGCAVSWVGAWLRRWRAEVGGWGGAARRAGECAGGGGRRALLALAPDAAECHASALASAAPAPEPLPPAFLWIVLLYSLS